MKFHKEGIPTLTYTLLFSACLSGLSYFFAPTWIFWLCVAISTFLLIVVLQFFRDPKRKINPEDINAVYTPADGKVVVIEKTFEPEFLKKECIQVSVFMSPLNVHINRNPMSGIVEYTKHHHGKYLAAWNPKSSTENERCTTVYKNEKAQVLIRQIAGALAKRIVNNLKTGQTVKQSEEMGFIKFGSRVDIFLPLDAEVKVKMNQMVKSPTDIIAIL